MNYLDLLNWRYATKQFDASKKIESSLWDSIEDSLVLTPSSFGLQPWKFIVITEPKMKASLREHSWGQAQVTDCSHFVVFCTIDSVGKKEIDALLDATVEARGGTREDLQFYEDLMTGHTAKMSESENFNWSKNQFQLKLFLKLLYFIPIILKAVCK